MSTFSHLYWIHLSKLPIKKVEALFLDFAIDLLSLFIQNISNHCCTCADETKQDVKRLCKECSEADENREIWLVGVDPRE
jgi:hypothetical protein